MLNSGGPESDERWLGSGRRLKTFFGWSLISGAALITICSILVHSFGNANARRSNAPLLLDSNFDRTIVKIVQRRMKIVILKETDRPVRCQNWNRNSMELRTTVSRRHVSRDCRPAPRISLLSGAGLEVVEEFQREDVREYLLGPGVSVAGSVVKWISIWATDSALNPHRTVIQ